MPASAIRSAMVWSVGVPHIRAGSVAEDQEVAASPGRTSSAETSPFLGVARNLSFRFVAMKKSTAGRE